MKKQEKAQRAKDALNNPVLMEILNRHISDSVQVFINAKTPIDDPDFTSEKWSFKLLAAKMELEAAGKIKEELTILHQGYAKQLAADELLKKDPSQDI